MNGIVDEWIDAMKDDHRGSNSSMREWCIWDDESPIPKLVSKHEKLSCTLFLAIPYSDWIWREIGKVWDFFSIYLSWCLKATKTHWLYMLSPKLQIHCICPYPTPTWCYSRADIEHFAIDTKPLIMGDRLLISISFVFLYRKFISMRAIKRQGILKSRCKQRPN